MEQGLRPAIQTMFKSFFDSMDHTDKEIVTKNNQVSVQEFESVQLENKKLRLEVKEVKTRIDDLRK